MCVCVCVCVAGVSCRLRKAQCYRQSFSPAISCWSSNRRTNVSVCLCFIWVCVLYMHTSHYICISGLSLAKETVVCVCVSGCLLTIILLMRALDPLGHEKETLAHFQTLKVRIYTTTTIKDALAAGNNQIIFIIKICIRVLKIRNAI